MYSMDVKDMEEWGDFCHEQESEDWAADHEHEAFAFQSGTSRPSFPPCTTQYCIDKSVSLTHSLERCYKRQFPSRFSGKGSFGSKGKGRGALLFNNHSAKGGKGKSKAKARAVEKVLDVARAKEAKEKWVKKKMVNLPSTREVLLSAISVWK